MPTSIKAGLYSAHWDENANLMAVTAPGTRFVPPVDCTFFKINDGGIEWDQAETKDAGLSYKPVPVSAERAASIRTQEMLPRFPEALRLSLSSQAGEVALRVAMQAQAGHDPEPVPSDLALLTNSPADQARISMTISVPATAVIHLAEHKNVGHRLDGDMPLEAVYDGALEYNLLLIEMDGFCIRLRTKDERLKNTTAMIRRHSDTFSVTFSWKAGSTALVGFFPTYEEAMADFRRFLENEKGLRRLKDRPDVPAWAQDIKLVLFIDLMLSNWSVLHDFNDVVEIARAAKPHIAPQQVLFYLSGWYGAYDGGHPAYRPDHELGGEQGLKRMVDQLHAWGFKIMLHTCAYGVDPYVADIEEVEKQILTKDGKLSGWQLCQERVNGVVSFDHRTRRIPLKPYQGQKKFKLSLGYIPGDSFAYLTVGGVSAGQGRIRLAHDRRQVISPTGWFEGHELHDYTYPIYYKCGQMELDVEISTEATFGLENAWLQIRNTTTYKNPYSTWTYPILHGSGANAEYVNTAAKNIAAVVKQYGIDAVHIDAAAFYPHGDRETFLAIKKAVPQGTLMGTEFYNTWEEAKFWMLSQNACQDIVTCKFTDICVREQESLPILEGVHDFYSWMDKTSPICDFIRDYLLLYPHLVAANAFVPTNKVSNIASERKIPLRDSEQWRVMRNASRLGYIAGLRVNFRKYGLDEQAVKAIELVAATQD